MNDGLFWVVWVVSGSVGSGGGVVSVGSTGPVWLVSGGTMVPGSSPAEFPSEPQASGSISRPAIAIGRHRVMATTPKIRMAFRVA